MLKEKNMKILRLFKAPFDRLKKCFEKQCPWVPACLFGCRFESIVEKSDIKRIAGKKETIDSRNNYIFHYLYEEDSI